MNTGTGDLLNQAARPTPVHHRILLMSWAGWVFDFYDLILYSFLLNPISQELKLTPFQHSWVMGFSLGMTALGGVVCGALADRFGVTKERGRIGHACGCHHG